jgi:hypothetical protein
MGRCQRVAAVAGSPDCFDDARAHGGQVPSELAQNGDEWSAMLRGSGLEDRDPGDGVDLPFELEA